MTGFSEFRDFGDLGFDKRSLTALRLRSGFDMRPTLLRVLTDLYVQKLVHTPDEERHYTELALRLLDFVDVPTRTAIGARLTQHLSPPLPILRQLARDLPDVAASVLRHPLLRAATASTAAAQIVQSHDTDKGEESGAVAEASPVTIDATTAAELNELFFSADSSERRLILLNLDVVAPLSAQPFDGFEKPAIGTSLEAAALARKREEFIGHLVRGLRIGRIQARRIAQDDLGEPVLVAGKALGIKRDVLHRILMFVNPTVGHSVERVHGLATLYDEMTPQAAWSLVAIWQALPKAESTASKYQPATRDSETRVRPAVISERVNPTAAASPHARRA